MSENFILVKVSRRVAAVHCTREYLLPFGFVAAGTDLSFSVLYKYQQKEPQETSTYLMYQLAFASLDEEDIRLGHN